MNTKNPLFVFLAFTVCLLFYDSATPAFAYLDPGTGTMLLQGIFAAIGAVMGFGYYYFDRLKKWFKSLRKVTPSATEPEILQRRHDEND